jgi:putative ABC transport system substrate-binding protein
MIFPDESIVRKNLSIIIFLSLIMLQVAAAAGQEAVVVQSARFAPYEEALKGFQRVCRADITRIVISELKRKNVVERIDEINPDIIIAIGMDALLKVKMIRDIPIVYLMILNPQSIISGEKNISGISMHISREKQLLILSEALPHVKRVGLVYDPEQTGYFVERARETAASMGLDLIANEVHSARDVPSSIKDLEGKIDAFWMIPDTTVITPETVEFLLIFSLENKTPILTFSEKYVELGALISIDTDPLAMGSQAGEMANRILSEKDYAYVERTDAKKEIIHINLKIAKNLGITMDEELLARAGIVK